MNREEMRAKISAADDLPREPVEVPWFDEKLYIRGLSGDEKDEWYARNMPNGDFQWRSGLTSSLLVKTLVTEDGDRLFGDDETEALGRKSAAVLSELMAVAMRLSGLNEETEVAVEEGFGNAQDGASSSV
jgi:hypothetical protein